MACGAIIQFFLAQASPEDCIFLSTLDLPGYMLFFHSPNAVAIISAQIYLISVMSLGFHLY